MDVSMIDELKTPPDSSILVVIFAGWNEFRRSSHLALLRRSLQAKLGVKRDLINRIREDVSVLID